MTTNNATVLQLQRAMQIQTNQLIIVKMSMDYGLIDVDFGGSPGTCPPIIEKHPCIYHFLPPSAPQYIGFPTQYFWQVYASVWTQCCKCHCV